MYDINILLFTVTNPCDRKKCEWLCLLSPSGPVCTCPNGQILDNGTCVEVPTPTLSPVCKSTQLLKYNDSRFKEFKVIYIHGYSHNDLCLCCVSAPSGTCTMLCLNGGTCVLNARKQPKCRCQPNYSGERCNLNQCRDYCQNGGTCTASPTGTRPQTHTRL